MLKSTIISVVYLLFNMQSLNCYEIKSREELFVYLIDNGVDYINNSNRYQLRTNFCEVHELKNGKVCVFPTVGGKNTMGLLLNSKECLQNLIENDLFPLENNQKTYFDSEPKICRNFKEDIPLLKSHSDSLLGRVSNFLDIVELENLFETIKKKKGNRNLKPIDFLSMGAMLGEKIISENQGYKWILKKVYGTWNPYFEPLILTNNNKVIRIFDLLLDNMDWKSKSLSDYFFKSNFLLNPVEDVKYYRLEEIIYFH